MGGAQLLMLTSSGAVMGAAFRNGRAMTIVAWAIAAAIMAINGTLLWELLLKELPAHWAARTGFLACVALYLGLVLYFALGPHRRAAVALALSALQYKGLPDSLK